MQVGGKQLAATAVAVLDRHQGAEQRGAIRTSRYGHYDVVIRDLHESDDLRVLDYNGERAFRLFRFDELPAPIVHDRTGAPARVRSVTFDDVF